MELKYFCLVALGNAEIMDGIKEDLLGLANTPPKYVDVAKGGVLITTFSSGFKPQEIKTHLNDENPHRIFFIYEIDDTVSATNLPVAAVYDTLFKDIEEMKESTVTHQVSGSTSESKTTTSSGLVVIPAQEFDVSGLSDEERKEMINDLIDKGFSNLTESDKKLLEILSQNP